MQGIDEKKVLMKEKEIMHSEIDISENLKMVQRWFQQLS